MPSLTLSRPTVPKSIQLDPQPAPFATLDAEMTSLRSLIHHCGCVDHNRPLEEVQRLFDEKRIEFLAVVRDGAVSGLCSRLLVGILLGSRFGFALNSRTPASSAQVERPLVFNESTAVRVVLDQALARDGDEFHEDVVLVDEHRRLLGLVPVDALARLQTRLVSDQLAELRRQHVELSEANSALRRTTGRYLGLFESHTLGVALLDPSGSVHEHNSRLAELLGIGRDDLALASVTAWVIEPERASFVQWLQTEARSASAPVTREFTLEIPGRGPRLFRCSNGWIAETGQICACFDDISEQRALERHLLRQEKQTLLDTLVGGIAHELNNKLTPVHGFAELIEMTTESQTREYAGLITRSVAESTAIIRQLLQLSKPIATHVQTVDLRLIAEEALSMLRFRIRESRCQVRTTLPPDPIWVRVDAAQIKQVVINLVLNALQAMGDRAHAMLEISAGVEAAGAVVDVKDNGIGIPPENLNRIFDPFFTTKGPERGTGLELSVCFSIVQQHDGAIDVESQPDKGARFRVTLPVARAPAALLGSESAPHIRPALRAAGARVLVVEDEVVVRRLMEEVLTTQFGCAVDVAANGIEAVEHVAQHRYALVISDVRMTGMTGTELYLWLRETQPASARRFVFVTGHPGDVHFEHAITQWNVPVITKPFTIAQLAEICRPFLKDVSTSAASA